MNKEKISSQEIIDLVATKASVSKRAAEEFLKVMISTIEDALLAGDIVKVKGFGTFKLQWNEPRKSVNVQTGDEITIDGYHKVSFVPEASLRELVNEPFAHLEAVELDNANNFIIPERQQEEVVLDPLRIFTEQASEIKDLLSEIQGLSLKPMADVELPVPPVEFELLDEVESYDELEVQLDLPDDESIETEVSSDIVDEDDIVVEPEPEIEDYSESLSQLDSDAVSELVEERELEPVEFGLQDEKVDVPIVAEVIEEKPLIAESISADVSDEDKAEFETSPFLFGAKKVRKTKKWLWVSIVSFILISGTVGLYLFCAPVADFGNKVILKSKNEITYLKENVSIPDMFSAVSKWFSREQPKKVIITETVVIPKDTTSEDSTELNESVDSLQLMFDNPRTYNEFIGSEQIKTGSRLTIMSLRYYGSKDFWVYIYEANKERIENPDNIQTGTLIRIPKLDSRLIDASNPRCLQKARELHDKYVNKKL